MASTSLPFGRASGGKVDWANSDTEEEDDSPDEEEEDESDDDIGPPIGSTLNAAPREEEEEEDEEGEGPQWGNRGGGGDGGPRGPRLPDSPPFKANVRQLKYEVNEDDLREFFTPCGTITDTVVIRDRETGKSKGFGFVTFETQDGLAKALEMAGTPLKGMNVGVEVAESRGGGGGRGGGPCLGA
mmetsp:Transcript_41948/g.111735  ORF Transcript_41948/g.111735 Transcript_41948/m.111735 type:complete len:185 (-) Transcript_41948:26-580(-)